MALEQQAYAGFGRAFINGVDVANCEKFSIAQSTKKVIEIADYRDSSGGMLVDIDAVDKISINLTLSEFTTGNILNAIRGTVSTSVETAFTDTIVAGTAGSLLSLQGIATITDVKVEDGAYRASVEGVDHMLTLSGVIALTTANYKVSGSYDAAETFEAFTQQATPVEVIAELENAAVPGQTIILRAHKVMFTPASTLDLLTGAPAKIELVGNVWKAKGMGVGKSAYYNLVKRQAV